MHASSSPTGAARCQPRAERQERSDCCVALGLVGSSSSVEEYGFHSSGGLPRPKWTAVDFGSGGWGRTIVSPQQNFERRIYRASRAAFRFPCVPLGIDAILARPMYVGTGYPGLRNFVTTPWAGIGPPRFGYVATLSKRGSNKPVFPVRRVRKNVQLGAEEAHSSAGCHPSILCIGRCDRRSLDHSEPIPSVFH